MADRHVVDAENMMKVEGALVDEVHGAKYYDSDRCGSSRRLPSVHVGSRWS